MVEDLLHVAVSDLDGVALLTVRGDIDVATVTTLQAALDAVDMYTTIHIDMADVGFMDSSGINAILSHALRMDEGHGSLEICRPSPAVRRVVEITGLEAVLFETRSDKALGFDNYQGIGTDRPSAEALHRSDSQDLVDEDVA